MTREKRLLARRKVIEILKDHSVRHGDLVKESGIPEATVERILKELEALGLVVHEGRFWCWRDYVFFDSGLEYQRALKHSRELIPGLEAILTHKEAILLGPYAVEHLKRGHPKVYGELKEFRRLEKMEEGAMTREAIEEAYQRLSGDICLLILRIDKGLIPLRGSCELCRPKIKIRPPSQI